MIRYRIFKKIPGIVRPVQVRILVRLAHVAMWAVVGHSVMSDFATPWAVTHQALWSVGFSRQGYWSGLPCPYPGDFPNPGVEPRAPALQVDSLPAEPSGKPACYHRYNKGPNV